MGTPGPHGAPICIARSLTEVKVENDAALKNLLTFPIAGAKLGDIYSLHAWGQRLNNKGESVTIKFKVVLGATVIGETQALTEATAANPAFWEFDTEIVVGSASLAVQGGHTRLLMGSTSVATTLPLTTGPTAGVGVVAGTENLAESKELKLQVQHSVADAEIKAILKGFILRRERA